MAEEADAVIAAALAPEDEELMLELMDIMEDALLSRQSISFPGGKVVITRKTSQRSRR